MAKYFDWNKEKNELLKQTRGISFEEIEIAIRTGGLLDAHPHPNQKRYPKQQIYAVKIEDYVYLVPFVEDEERFFLKTIIPSRKATRKYLKQ